MRWSYKYIQGERGAVITLDGLGGRENFHGGSNLKET